MDDDAGVNNNTAVVTPLDLIARLLSQAQLEYLAGGLVHVLGPECKGHGSVTIEIRKGAVLYIATTVKER